MTVGVADFDFRLLVPLRVLIAGVVVLMTFFRKTGVAEITVA